MRELIGCAILGVSIAVAACTTVTGSSVASNTVTTYSPVTGIEVDANTLFSRDGCGRGPGTPFKYVVSVYQAFGSGPLEGQRISSNNQPPDPIAIALSDCFTDVVFENLTSSASVGGSATFSLAVDVYNDATFNKDYADTIVPNVYADPNSQVFSPSPTAANAAAVDAIANWTTTCVVRQQPNVQSLAACDPLVATGH